MECFPPIVVFTFIGLGHSFVRVFTMSMSSLDIILGLAVICELEVRLGLGGCGSCRFL